MSGPLPGSILVLLCLAVAMAGVYLLGARYHLAAETRRKLVHIAMGLVTLSFPWLFDEPLPVLLLAAAAALGLVVLRLSPTLKEGIGSVLHGVARTSLGELYFPLAVALLFALSQGNTLLYVAPILTLSLADAVAALVGVRYGHHPFTTSGGWKSVEGSLAFLVAATVSVLVPCLWLGSMDFGEALALALLTGMLVMLFEAVSSDGLDNLFIPLGCYGLLLRFQELSTTELWLRLLALLALAVFLFGCRGRNTLKGSGQLAALLAGYLFWMLGGWQYLGAGLLFYFGYTRIWPQTEVGPLPVHSVRAIASIVVPACLWLLVSLQNPGIGLGYSCFVTSLAANMTVVGMLQFGYTRPQSGLPWRIAQAAVRSWLLFTPVWLMPLLTGGHPDPGPFVLFSLASSLPALIGAAVLYQLLAQRLGHDPTGRIRWLGYGAIALLTSGTVLLAGLSVGAT